MTDATTGELSRRLDEMRREMREQFRDVNKSLADIPNVGAIAALLEVRDTRIANQDKRLDDLTRALATEVSSRQAADKQEELEREKALENLQNKIDAGRKWLVGTIIGAVGTLVGILAFVSNLGGGAPS